MNGNDARLMDIGNSPTNTIVDSTNIGYVWTWPYDGNGTYIYPNTTIYTTPTEPYYCTGNCHVFGCDHATKCKCGKSTRKVEPPKCAHCGKSHT